MTRNTLAPSGWVLRAAVVTMAALALGCGDRLPAGPRAVPNLDHELLVSEPLGVQLATRVAPLGDGVTASAWISPRGGALVLPEAGLVMVFPQGAVQVSTRVTARALPGAAVAYEFEPHGITFEQPVLLLQQFNGAHGVDVSGGIPSFSGAYFADASQIDQAARQAYVNEILPATVDPARRLVGFSVHHFSGYMLASGRAAP